MKIFDPHRKRKFTVREVHRFTGKLSSIQHVRDILADEFEEEVPASNTKYNLGYFEGKYQTKRWLASAEDFKMMYTRYLPGSEIFLWCDGREADSEDTNGKGAETRKSANEGTVNKRKEREEELDSIFRKLQEKHDDAYSVPQLRLWARMIVSGTHDDLENPPRVPMIVGHPLAKRPKHDESMTSAITSAATAIASALSPHPSNVPATPQHVSSSMPPPLVGISPGKAADIRMKNLEQLRYTQQLMEDGILTPEEFVEQKKIILKSLRGLNV